MLDQFSRRIDYMRLSVTELCNLRCRYCMPETGICKRPRAEILTEDEMISAVEAAASLGIRKLRITGGEPLVKKNILSICARSSAVSGIEELCLTTNGILLPPMAHELKARGISRINLSLDTLNEAKYAHMTRWGRLDQAMAGLQSALSAGFEKVKINSVLIGGFNDDEIADLAGLTLKYPVDVRFIEMMPMYDSGDFGPEAYIPQERVLEKLSELIPAGGDGVARLYRLPGAMGNIGLISPVSHSFCARCNRIRLTADGRLKPCLHSSLEYSIKGLSPEEVRRTMAEAIFHKPACHSELTVDHRSQAGRNMNQIGG